ncbi:hypothetical protein LTR93_011955 [Exophiala xenobiotica]|nr:hypothetical protein LTR93_011955 [Exophiala xenobiotica]
MASLAYEDLDSSSTKMHFARTLDLVTLAFDHPTFLKDDNPIYIDAKYPPKVVSWSQASQIFRQLVMGLKEHGLKEGGTVCCQMPTNVKLGLYYNMRRVLASQPSSKPRESGAPLADKCHYRDGIRDLDGCGRGR